jgi:hypothetical protein
MAYTTAHLAALQAALASGVTSVSYQGRSVTYASIADLEKAIRIVQADLNQTAGIRSTRQVRVYANKGFNNSITRIL